MAYRNRNRLRAPLALVRGDIEEQEAMDELIDAYGGVSRGEAYRLALLEMVRIKRHARNSLAADRITQTVDRNAFGGLIAA